VNLSFESLGHYQVAGAASQRRARLRSTCEQLSAHIMPARPSSLQAAIAAGGGGGQQQRRRRSSNASNKSGGGGQQQQQQQRRRSSNASNRSGGGGGGGGKQRQRSTGNAGGNNNPSSLRAAAAAAAPAPSLPKISSDDIELLQTAGCGDTPAQKAVARYSVAKFLTVRMKHLEEPTISETPDSHRNRADPRCVWTPHKQCHWTNRKNRLDSIQAEMDKLFNYAPLEVNNETRWKAKVMTKVNGGSAENNGNEQQEDVDVEVIMGKAVSILNKLSWTTLEKLTTKFIQAITITENGSSTATGVVPKEIIDASMSLVLEKASHEPHFAELYANFAMKISRVHKSFRKTLLYLCQEEFEKSDTIVVEEDLDPAEREMEILKARKKTIGLMRFIGELYKMKLLKGVIMISCLQRLVKEQDDEDRLECFSKLLTTVGESLEEEVGGGADEQQQLQLKEMWAMVYTMAGRVKDTTPGAPKAPSTRIKFLFQDLIEFKENGWVQRRKEEKAKTLAQIQKDVAKEEKQAVAASRRLHQNRPQSRSQSGASAGRGKVGRGSDSSASGIQCVTSKPDDRSQGDHDGFVPVVKPKRNSTQKPKSSLQMALASSSGKTSPPRNRSRSPKLMKKVTEPAAASPLPPPLPQVIPEPRTPDREYLEPSECGKKAKNVLQEYFVGGDTDDAVLSIHELVGVGTEGDVDRAASVVQETVLMVLEMKEENVQKLLAVLSRCVEESKIPKESLVPGLNDPLEFLRDIEIDAPHAATFLAMIVADWLKRGAIELDFLSTSAPEYFRREGRPADFARRVLAERGGDISDAEVDVVASLMSEEEKVQHNMSDTRKFLESLP